MRIHNVESDLRGLAIACTIYLIGIITAGIILTWNKFHGGGDK